MVSQRLFAFSHFSRCLCRLTGVLAGRESMQLVLGLMEGVYVCARHV